MIIRLMIVDDYTEMFELWQNTPGMGMRNLDDSLSGISSFLKRNPNTNFVAIDPNAQKGKQVIGTILCGHDGRRGHIYHACVDNQFRRQGIGNALIGAALEALQKENIHKATLVVFKENEGGNAFWQAEGWEKRDDLNNYTKSLNNENI